MKRKIDWEEKKQSEREVYSDEESDEEEPWIKDVLDNLSQTVSRRRASELLHSMATSEDILFWTPAGSYSGVNNSSDKHLRAGRVCVTSAQRWCSQTSCAQQLPRWTGRAGGR